MKTLINKLYILIPILVIIAGISQPGCSDNPVTPTEHFEAEGLILKISGAEVVRVENGTATGNLAVTVGTLSPHMDLKFIDEDGNVGLPEGEEYSATVTVADPDIAEIVFDEPGDWDFHIRGLKEGTTTIRIALKHGDHDDFVSPDITLEVDHEDHGGDEGVHGVVLKRDGSEILRADDEGNVSTGLSISDFGTTPLEVWFLDHDGEEVRPEEEHLEIVYTVDDGSILEAAAAQDDRWMLVLTPVKTGTTTLRVALMHEGEPLFESSPIQVSVIQ